MAAGALRIAATRKAPSAWRPSTQQMTVTVPQLPNRSAIECALALKRTQLGESLIGKRCQQLPSLAHVTEQSNDPVVQARILVPENSTGPGVVGMFILGCPGCMLRVLAISVFIKFFISSSRGPAVTLYTQVPFGPADSPGFPQQREHRGRHSRSRQIGVRPGSVEARG
jgi:hypothetical protein